MRKLKCNSKSDRNTMLNFICNQWYLFAYVSHLLNLVVNKKTISCNFMNCFTPHSLHLVTAKSRESLIPKRRYISEIERSDSKNKCIANLYTVRLKWKKFILFGRRVLHIKSFFFSFFFKSVILTAQIVSEGSPNTETHLQLPQKYTYAHALIFS